MQYFSAEHQTYARRTTTTSILILDMNPNRSRSGQRKRRLVVTLLGDYSFKKERLQSNEFRQILPSHYKEGNDAPVSKDFFEMLSADVCAEIFMYLPLKDRIKSERVCRRWKAILESHAWRKTRSLSYWTLRDHLRIALAGADAKITQDEIYSMTVRCGKYLRNVNLECLRIADLSPHLTPRFLTKCSNLSSLHLADNSLTPDGLRAIGASCPLLEHFTSSGEFTEKPSDAIFDFFQCCRQLQKIVLSIAYKTPSGRRNGHSDGLRWVAALPGSLTSIRFTWCHFSERALETVTNLCPTLRNLQIDSYALQTAASISGNPFAACQELTTLCLELSTYRFSRIGERIGTLTNLLELFLAFARLTPPGMSAIAKGCSKLRCLSLKVVRCERVDLGSLVLLQNLTCLGLGRVIFYDVLPDENAQNAIDGGENENIEFGLDDELLNRIAGMGQLRFLSLDDCSDLTSHGIAHALENNKKLICLVIKRCPNILTEQAAVCEDLLGFVNERRENTSEEFSWSCIERDIGGYIAIDDYDYTSCSSRGLFPYNDFRSYLRSYRLNEASPVNGRFDELHIWFPRSLRPRMSHPLLRYYNSKDVPYILHAGYQTCKRRFSRYH